MKIGFAGEVRRMWPALPYLGLGLWLTWPLLAFSGGVWLSDVESSGENISRLFIASSVTMALLVFGAAYNSRLANRLLGKTSFLIGAGIVGALGSLLVVLSGPYYLGSLIGMNAFPFFILGGVLCGLASGTLLLKGGTLYGTLTPKRVLLYSSLSHLLLACIYFIVIGTPSWHPLPGGPPISGIAAFVLALPVAAMVLSLAPVHSHATEAEGRQNTQESSSAQNPQGAQSTPGTQGAPETERLSDSLPDAMSFDVGKLPSTFWKFLFMLLVFATVISMIHAVFIELHPVEATLQNSSFVMFLRIVMACVFVVLSLGIGTKHLNFGKIYSLIAVILVVTIALLPALGVLDTNGNLVISTAIILFEFILWCLLAIISYQRAASPVIVWGFGYGIYTLGNTLGWFLGSSQLPHLIDDSTISVYYLVIAGIVLALAFLFFSERDLNRLFSPLDHNGVSLNELMQEDLTSSAPDAMATEDEGGEGLDERRGRFAQQLADLANAKGLSPREAEVLRPLAIGRSPDFISKQLSISWNTARSHVHNVYVKLNVHSHQELIDIVDSLKAHPK